MDRSKSDLNSVEARLAGWRPTSAGMDRDRMLFLAGKSAAKAESRVRLATVSAAFSSVLVLTLGVVLVREYGQRRAAEVALAEAKRAIPSPPVVLTAPTLDRPSASSYFVLTRQGIDFDGRHAIVAFHSTDPLKPDESRPLRVSDRTPFPEL